MKKLLSILFIITLVSCTTQNKDAERQAFIDKLTQNTWFLPDPANPNIASTTPIVFDSDGSFTYDFEDLDGNIIPTLFTLEIVGHEFFAFYSFTYTLGKDTLQLSIGVGIGLNTVSQKPVVYQGEFEETPTEPAPTANPQEIREWYEALYRESNIITHKGPTLAIQ